MTDRYGYTAPARIKVLLVPVHNLHTQDFAHYTSLLQATNDITLLDITPMPELRYFNPQTFPQGRLFYDFLATAPDEAMFLHDFEPARKTFVVLGLGRYDLSLTKLAVELFNLRLKLVYPTTIVQNTIIFDTPSDIVQEFNPPRDHSLKETFFYPNDRSMSLESVLGDISRNFLHNLDQYAASYATITLRSPVSMGDRQLLARTIAKAQKRASGSMRVLFPIDQASSSPNGAGTSTIASTSTLSTGSRTSTSGSRASSGTITETSPGPGSTASSGLDGRHAKLLASLYLLAGKYTDALHHFTDSLLHLRKSDDSIWMGSALEGIGVLVILLNYVHVSYQLPNAVLATVLLLSKSKIRDMSIENVSRMSGDTTRTSGDHNSPRHSIAGPRTSGSGSSVAPALRTSFGSTFGGSGPDLSLIAVPELVKQLALKVDYYFQLSTNDFENTVPDLVYIESLLRHITFMVSVYRHGSIDHSLYENLVKPLAPALAPGLARPSSAASPWFSKADILVEIEKIFSLQLVDLDLVDQCRIYCAIAATYDAMNMTRKKSFILRTLMVAILPKLEGTGKNIEPSTGLGPGPNGASALDGPNNSDLDITTNGTNNGTTTGAGAGTTGANGTTTTIRGIISTLFQDYGINSASPHSNWPLQLLVLKLSITVLESVQDYDSLVAVYCLALTRYVHCLPVDDELQLKRKIDELLRSTNVRVPYWDPLLVRGTKFVNKHQADLVPFTEYSQGGEVLSLNQDIASTSTGASTGASTGSSTGSSTGTSTTGGSGVKFFDPFNKPATQTLDKDKLLTRNEIYQLKVTLQNPYSFEVDITDIQIVAEGVAVEVIRSGTRSANGTVLATVPSAVSSPKLRTINNPKRSEAGTGAGPSTGASTGDSSTPQNISIIIPPKSLEVIILPFKPLESGALKIIGFNIIVGNCEPEYFPIEGAVSGPISPGTTKVKPSGPTASASGPIVSASGPGAGAGAGRTGPSGASGVLDLLVIESQPTLSLTNLLVSNGWLMLLEGEKHPFTINLTNQSDQTINYLSFSFWDSTIQALSKRLNSSTVGNQLSPAETHEIEWHLLKFKSFKILNKQEINQHYNPISPYQDIKIDYEITGKKGMMTLKMILEYGNKTELSKSFVKSVEIPLNLTVIPSVELISYDIIPFFSWPDNCQNRNLSMLHDFVGENVSQYCLLVLDLRNSWEEEIEIDLAYHVNGSGPFTIVDTLKPKKTGRYLVPIERISASKHNLSARIPSLRNKQYVKDYLVTEQEELDRTQAFWLREMVLNNLKAQWKCGTRHGVIMCRNLRLTSTMAACMVYPKVHVAHQIKGPGGPVHTTDLQVRLETEQFYTLHTTITNNSDEVISGMLRHIPFALNADITARDHVNIDKKMLINGVTQRQLPKALGPKEVLVIELSFVVLEKGEYEWGSILDIGSKIVARPPLHIVAS